MIALLKTPVRAFGTLLLAGVLAVAQTGAPQPGTANYTNGQSESGVPAVAQAGIARPGALNYTEGQVELDGQPLGPKQVLNTELQPGQVLSTKDGRAEMLLTPGVFLRQGHNSAVRMVSNTLTDTQVELLRGEALVSVTDLVNGTHLTVLDNGAKTWIQTKGLYDFNATQPRVSIYDGWALVQAGNQNVQLKKGEQLPLVVTSAQLEPGEFNINQTDALYNWSKVRSEYEAKANMASAQMVATNQPSWWYGTGWYWNSWFDTWAFVPASGYLYSPFGFGFYSPAYWYFNAPLFFSAPERQFRERPFEHGEHFGQHGEHFGQHSEHMGRAGTPPAVGGSGVQFGALGSRGAIARPSAPPAMRAPEMGGFHAPAMGGFHAPAMGGFHTPAMGGFHAPAMGGFHTPAMGGFHAPAMGGFHAPAVGGSGVHFGAVGRR